MMKFINNYLLVYIIDKIKVFNRIGLRNISDFVRYIFYVLKNDTYKNKMYNIF